ncbi:MAG: family 16 glycoside hydrolase [Verrucomicrobiota bacterium]
MKNSLSLFAVIGSLALAGAPSLFAQDGFRNLFNGSDLSGWSGNPLLWSVRDGAITGQTTKQNPTQGNTFLIWTNGVVDEFELHFSYKIIGGNSGVQYRSKVINKDKWVVGGYQADFEAGKTYSGILYDEAGVAGGRGIMAQRGEKVVWTEEGKKEVVGDTGKTSAELQAAIKAEDWNDYVVIAQGNHLVHKINGNVTVDVTDNDPKKRLASGVLALQVHAGPPMTVQFKNIRLKPLGKSAAALSDLEKLQGKWVPAEMTHNGEKFQPEVISVLRVTVKGNEYSVDGTDDPDRGTFKIDETVSPRKMDISSHNGTEVPAIYEVTDDAMKVCYGLNGSGRPTDFTAPAGSDRLLAIYKRKTE